MSLRERLDGLIRPESEQCAGWRVVDSCDSIEDSQMVFECLANPNVSMRAIVRALRAEGVRCSTESLGDARRCMRKETCTCDWEKFVK
jgi:hypothetical protein